jgi:hypothetical protein
MPVMFKKLLFTILILLNASLSFAGGLITDTDLFTSNGVVITPKYGMTMAGSGGAGVTVGTSVITGGTTGYLLYNNGGILGNLNPAGLTLAWSQITGTPTTLSGYGITSPLPINQGGTNATAANTGLNNLLPSQGGNSGLFLTTNGTNSTWASPKFTSRAAAYLSTGQSLPNGVTEIQFDTLIPGFGSTTEFDITINKGRFTSTNGGVYQVTARVYESSYTSTTNFDDFTLIVYKNTSTQYAAGNIVWAAGNTFQPSTNVSVIIQLNAGEYFDVEQYNNTFSTNTFTAITGQVQSWIQIVQVQ